MASILANALLSRDITDVSKSFPTLLTPRDSGFAIWGIIYALQVGYHVQNLFFDTRGVGGGLHWGWFGCPFWCEVCVDPEAIFRLRKNELFIIIEEFYRARSVPDFGPLV